jgi:hypothetical protein
MSTTYLFSLYVMEESTEDIPTAAAATVNGVAPEIATEVV